jgi:tetratricopeptide (TPR) repeat protein
VTISDDDISERVESLVASLDRAADAPERARILVEIAVAFRDGLHDESQALDALIEAWHADPTNEKVLDHLEPLARAQGRWDEVLDTTRTLFVRASAPKVALAYAEAMVRWSTREVARPDLAHEYLEQVRAIDGTHWLVRLFQAAKYEEHGDVKRELEELDRAVMSAKRADDRARIHLMMASRYEDARSPNAPLAKRHLSAAHALQPKSLEALRGLERIHERDGDLPALAEVLEKQVSAIETESEQVALLRRLAEIYEKQFLKPDMAAERLERAFALDPNNETVLADLERCYTAMRSWDDLVRVLEGAIALVDDPQERAERLVALAEIYESKLRDVARAVSAYERLEKLLPDDETLVGELARLAEKMGDWKSATAHRSKLAELAPDPRTRARMHAAAGQLALQHDPPAARREFEKAVAADPTNAAAWTALLADARKSNDLALVAGYLERRIASMDVPRAQAQLCAELGNVRLALGNESGATVAWEAAVAADPGNEAAARALLGVYVKKSRWKDAIPLCDVALHAAEREGDLERLFLARRQAYLVVSHVGRWGRALATAVSMFQMRPGAPDVPKSLIESAWNMRADPQVLDAIEALVTIARDPATLRTLAPDTWAQLGEVFAVTGERENAIAIYEGVLRVQPDNAVALRGLAGLRAARGESIAAWTLKRQLADTVGDEQERFRLLVETADGFASQAKRPDLAVEAYEKARALRPKDHVILHKLVAQYQTLENWSKVVELLRAVVGSDEDATRKAKVVMTMGQIAHGKLGNQMGAVALYDEALDLDPARLDAFERITRVLSDRKDWRGLEAAYQRMIARAVGLGDAPLRHVLHRQLGLLCRDFIGDRGGAIASFRVAVELQPDDEESQAALRDLLAMAGKANDAVALTLERVRRDLLDPTPYPPLFDLLMRLGDGDLAWRVAAVMAHLGALHEGAAAFYAANPSPPPERIPGSLGVDGYRWLIHQNLDPTLTSIFEVMASAAVDMRLAQLGFRERLAHPGPAFNRSEFLDRAVKDACRILGVAPARLYTAKSPPAIGVGVTRPPSLLVHAESLAGYPLNQLVFWVGKRVAELTPPLLAHALFRSVSELKELVAAAARIVQEKGDKLSRADELWRSHIGRDRFRELSVAIERALSAGALDVRRWSQLADLSSSRAGLVVTGDLETARLALVREGQSPGDLAPREQMRDLVGFFLGDSYAQLRAQLGVRLVPVHA